MTEMTAEAMIEVRRVYGEAGQAGPGYRVLVDRMWPRGLSKEQVRPDLWLKDISPSPELRRWFGHDPARWEEFRRRYFAELAFKPELVGRLVGKAREGRLVLLYGAREERFNNAVALKQYLESLEGRAGQGG